MGFGCKGQLPGMGGVNQSENFLLNCSGWKDFFNEIIKTDKTSLQNIKITPDKLLNELQEDYSERIINNLGTHNTVVYRIAGRFFTS